MDKKTFNVRLEPELIAAIKIQAIQENRSVSVIVAELLREYLKKGKPKK